jgi:MGT family glycosyltransferase
MSKKLIRKIESIKSINMQESTFIKNIHADYFKSSGKRILFATVPGDGHFNPLTGLAVHLKYLGYDVRWYTSPIYSDKLRKLQIQHYSFKKALDVHAENAEQLFPERKNIKGMIKRLCFDLINGFILRSTEYFEDIKAIHSTFPFDMVICDCIFMAIPFIKEKLNIPVISIGVLPLTEKSKDLAPAGLGLMPSKTFFGRRKQDVLRIIADKILFRKPNRVMKDILNRYGIKVEGSNAFDMLIRKSTLLLQSGTPGFEYHRSDLGKNIRFIGALLPYNSKNKTHSWYNEKLSRYNKVILVTQGTVEKDTSKLLVPTLEAFKDSDYLLLVTTGGSGTKQLKEKYAYDNIIIEDFIPFADVMPYADVYITNGGYGGVMLSIENKLPMVTAGVHEGKSEINARVEYFKLGISLRTEKPTPLQIRSGVEKVLNDVTYQNNIEKLSKEFNSYNPNELCASYINEVLGKQDRVKVF